MTPVTFRVLGEPRPKGSTKGFVRRSKGGKLYAAITSDNPNLKAWEDTIRHEAQRVGAFFDGPVSVTLAFGFQRPKSVSLKRRPHHVVKPDLDKLSRGAIDALSRILFGDDAAVVALSAKKAYITDGPPFVDITVEPVS